MRLQPASELTPRGTGWLWPGWLVLDPLTAFLDPGVLAASDQSVRRVLGTQRVYWHLSHQRARLAEFGELDESLQALHDQCGCTDPWPTPTGTTGLTAAPAPARAKTFDRVRSA